MKKFLLIFALFAASSCTYHNPMPKTTDALTDETAENTKSFRASVADFIYPESGGVTTRAEPIPGVTVRPYCYTSWDKPVCYNRPVAGEDDRLVGE